jgi:HlyD family secretion protein
MSRKKVIIGGALLLAVIILFAAVSMKKNKQPATEVQTAKCEPIKIVESVTATGKIQPVTQVKISADVAGKITHLPVKEGQWIEKGGLLVQLERARYQAAVEQAEANLRSAEANATLVKENVIQTDKEYLRSKELFDKNLESKAALDQANANVQVEKARYQSTLEQVDQARASVKQAREELAKTTIYAPMAGTISKLNKEVGEIALGSQFQEDVILIISNLAGMEALVDVDENDIVRVSVGDSAVIEVDALPGKTFHGTVSEMASSAKITGSGTTEQKTEFEVKIAITDPGQELREGMTADGEIITETKPQTIGVPIQCVTLRSMAQLKTGAGADSSAIKKYTPDKDGYVTIIFLLANGVTTARQVKTGIQSETHIEIGEGLAVGEEYVTGSYRAISQTLQNGSKVTVKNSL